MRLPPFLNAVLHICPAALLLLFACCFQVAGPPGNAFDLVYGGVTDRVRSNMHAADPALGEWIR